MTDETEDQELEGPLAVEWPDPIYLQAPDGSGYCIADDGALCALLGVDSVIAYRVTDAVLEWLTEKRRWESVEAPATGPKVARLKN